MNGIQIFKSNEFGAIRTLSNPQGQPLFCAKDVASALGFQDTHSAIHRYVAEKELSILGALDTLGRKNYITFMTKRGMQALDSELVARTCAEIEDALENLYKTCVHSIDSLRSLLSYCKEDMRLSRSGN